jgi:two-component system cell cycle response regulator DivK
MPFGAPCWPLIAMPTLPIVLLVDDHEDTLAMYAIGLMAMNFRVVTATTAERALGLACAHRPDAIVLDAWLSGSSGSQLALELRGDTRTRHAGIVMLSGDDHARAAAMDAGCDRFILKPCSPGLLALEVGRLLARSTA